MSVRQRWLLWITLLCLTLFAIWYPIPHTPPIIDINASSAPTSKQPAEGKKPQIASSHEYRGVDNMQLHDEAAKTVRGADNPVQAQTAPLAIASTSIDLFAPAAWDVAPRAPVPVAVVPKPIPVTIPPPLVPQEPPFPYKLLGRMKEDGGENLLYLSRGEESLVARVGDILNDQYKVVSVDEASASIEYLPLGLRHELALSPR